MSIIYIKHLIFISILFISLKALGQLGVKKSFQSILNNNAQSIILGWSGGQASNGSGIANKSPILGMVGESFNIGSMTQTTTIKYELGFTHWNDRLNTSLTARQAINDHSIEIYGGWVWSYPIPYWKNGVNAIARLGIEALLNLPLKHYSDFIGTKVRFAAVSHSLHSPVEYGSVDAAYTYFGGVVASKWNFTIK